MNKFIASVFAALALIALPALASAKSIQYDFEMTVTEVWDENGTGDYADYNGRESASGYGIFDGLTVGSKINVSVDLDSSAPVNAGSIQSDVFQVTITGSWGGTYGYAAYWKDGGSHVWQAQTNTGSESLEVNGQDITGGVAAIKDLRLVFSSDSPWTLSEGFLDFRVENGGASRFYAKYVPTAVPELDPASGMSAVALLGGGVAILMARRRDAGSFAS